MNNIKILDCTLRDGGYINNWEFGKEIITQIAERLATAHIDIIEVGFLTALPHTEEQSLYANSVELDAVTRNCKETGSKIAAMIALGEKELDPVILPDAKDTNLDIVRITFHNSEKELDKAFRYAECLQTKGYLVCMQPVGTTSYTDKELLELIEKVNCLCPYAFYLVDTLGVLHRRGLAHFVDLIDCNLKPEICLGFHSHNNLQMSYANAQFISEFRTEREFIIDSSIYGMGRGAGNLCTELFAQFENEIGVPRYQMMPIYEVLDDYIYPIFMHLRWGYNAHYYVSATHHCHPNYASFLMNKQTLTMNEVDLILKNIPGEHRYIYNKNLVEELYYNFQNHAIDDTETCQNLSKQISGREVLLLAPGKSLQDHIVQLKEFIEKENPIVFSINAQSCYFHSDYVFISNLKRLYMTDMSKMDVPVILTSNLPNIIRDGIYVDYAALCDKHYEEMDNSGIMLIRLMKKLGLHRVYIAGYDGFSSRPKDNYFDQKLVNSVDLEKMQKKTVSIGKQLKEIKKYMEIVSLTPSKYLEGSYETV